MSKKSRPISRPPNFDNDLPMYFKPPMTDEDYRYYEREFFGFLDDKPDKNQDKEEENPGFVQRFLQRIGISKTSKSEDEVPAIKSKVDHVLENNVNNETSSSRLGDNLNGGTSATITNHVPVVKKVNKATQTEDVATSDQGVQTEKVKRGFLRSCRRFFRRSFKCLKTVEE